MAFNRRLLTIEIAKQWKPIYAQAKPLMEKRFEASKQEMLKIFDEHDITRALKAGAENSATLDGLIDDEKNGGNLYSLIGFDKGTDPTEPLRDMLEKDTRLNISQTKRELKNDVIVFRTPVRMPTLATVHKAMASAVPELKRWTTRGFTDLIERGVTGFRQYLFDMARQIKGSHSGHAVEVKGQLRKNGYRGRRYVSEILSRFRELIGLK